jgi:cyclomaltodextrinase / maltogenic alpha-amylase / neopullulanase
MLHRGCLLWRAAIKQHKPDALTISETWFDSSKYFLGDAFDTTMNYIFRNTILEYANGGKAKNLYHNIELIREVYPPQSFYALMNLTSSHDQPRALHQFGYIDDKSDAAAITLAKQRQRLTVFFQMIFPGAPTIYYGDEVGVTGGEDPYNRATYPWADLGGKPDNALLADFKTLIKMRKDHAVLRHGSIDAPIFIDDNVIVLLRKLNDIWAITATNNAAASKTVTVKLPEPGGKSFANALTKDIVNTTNGNITFTIPPLFGTVLITP